MDIFAAIAEGDAAAALACLDADPELGRSRRKRDGTTPVMFALYQGHPDLARALAARVGELGLAEAAALDGAARVRVLLGAGAEVDERSPDGFTPLQYAAFFAAPDAAAVLLDAGADVHAVAANTSRVRPLHAAVAGRCRPVVERLVAAGADVNARQQGGFTPLHAAALNGDDHVVRLLLDAGADPRQATDEGVRAAELAASAGHESLAELLRAAAGSLG
jgi:ankyrin repeat protein